MTRRALTVLLLAVLAATTFALMALGDRDAPGENTVAGRIDVRPGNGGTAGPVAAVDGLTFPTQREADAFRKRLGASAKNVRLRVVKPPGKAAPYAAASDRVQALRERHGSAYGTRYPDAATLRRTLQAAGLATPNTVVQSVGPRAYLVCVKAGPWACYLQSAADVTPPRELARLAEGAPSQPAANTATGSAITIRAGTLNEARAIAARVSAEHLRNAAQTAKTMGRQVREALTQARVRDAQRKAAGR